MRDLKSDQDKFSVFIIIKILDNCEYKILKLIIITLLVYNEWSVIKIALC